jgi:hypothetical protein
VQPIPIVAEFDREPPYDRFDTFPQRRACHDGHDPRAPRSDPSIHLASPAHSDAPSYLHGHDEVVGISTLRGTDQGAFLAGTHVSPK